MGTNKDYLLWKKLNPSKYVEKQRTRYLEIRKNRKNIGMKREKNIYANEEIERGLIRDDSSSEVW